MDELMPVRIVGALERTRHENRGDFRNGFGSSVVVHAALIAVAFSLAATMFVISEPPVAREQPIQIMTIEKLVQDQPRTAQVHPSTQRDTASAASQSARADRSASQSLQLSTLAINQRTASKAESGSQGFSMTAGRLGHHKAKPSQSKPSATQPELATVSSATAQAATNGTTVGVQAQANQDNEDDGGGYMSPGRGPVWSEHAPAGPMGGSGGGHDSCTPSRGGFFFHRH